MAATIEMMKQSDEWNNLHQCEKRNTRDTIAVFRDENEDEAENENENENRRCKWLLPSIVQL